MGGARARFDDEPAARRFDDDAYIACRRRGTPSPETLQFRTPISTIFTAAAHLFPSPLLLCGARMLGRLRL